MSFTKGECGCKVVSSFLVGNEIEYCPKHKAAPDMYEALKKPIIHPQSVAVDTLSDAQCRAELKRVCNRIDTFKDTAYEALVKAEGMIKR